MPCLLQYCLPCSELLWGHTCTGPRLLKGFSLTLRSYFNPIITYKNKNNFTYHIGSKFSEFIHIFPLFWQFRNSQFCITTFAIQIFSTDMEIYGETGNIFLFSMCVLCLSCLSVCEQVTGLSQYNTCMIFFFPPIYLSFEGKKGNIWSL